MDQIDEKILAELNKNSRATVSEISRQANLSIPAVGERIRKLEHAGIIEKYTIKINNHKIGYKLLAFISVTIDNPQNTEVFKSRIAAHPAVLEMHHTIGEYDYLLKVLLQDTQELEFFLTNVLKKIKGVVKSNTVISLSQIKEVINIER